MNVLQLGDLESVMYLLIGIAAGNTIFLSTLILSNALRKKIRLGFITFLFGIVLPTILTVICGSVYIEKSFDAPTWFNGTVILFAFIPVGVIYMTLLRHVLRRS